MIPLIERLSAVRDYVDENPVDFRVSGATESDEQAFIRYYGLMNGMLPDLLKAVDVLREAKGLLLEMGNAVRHLDDDDRYLGFWLNDGDCIIDERFGKVDRALRVLDRPHEWKEGE